MIEKAIFCTKDPLSCIMYIELFLHAFPMALSESPDLQKRLQENTPKIPGFLSRFTTKFKEKIQKVHVQDMKSLLKPELLKEKGKVLLSKTKSSLGTGYNKLYDLTVKYTTPKSMRADEKVAVTPQKDLDPVDQEETTETTIHS